MSNTAESNYGSNHSFDNTIDQASKRAAEVGKKISSTVQETAHEMREVGGKAIDELSRRGSDQLHRVEQYVRDEPLKSVAIAAGIGAFLGVLLRR